MTEGERERGTGILFLLVAIAAGVRTPVTPYWYAIARSAHSPASRAAAHCRRASASRRLTGAPSPSAVSPTLAASCDDWTSTVSTSAHIGADTFADPLWWALAFGAGFGGNGTIIGSTANIIVVTLSERTRTPITSSLWNRRGLPVMLVTCAIASILYIVLYNSF